MRRSSFLLAMATVWLSLLPSTSNALIVKENYMYVAIPFTCSVAKSAAIFTQPKMTYHVMSVYSVHWNVDVFARVQNVHYQFFMLGDVDAISIGHLTNEGLGVTKVYMATEFYTERCVPDGIEERETIKTSSVVC